MVVRDCVRAIHIHGRPWIVCMTAKLDVTPKTTKENWIVRTGKSVAKVTNRPNKKLRSVTVLLKLTTDRQEVSRGLFATAELLVISYLLPCYCTDCLSDAIWTSNWQHWCYTAVHRRISQTPASQRLRPVAVSTRLAPSHASYRGPEFIPVIWQVSANSEDSWKRYCLSRTRLRLLVTLAFRRQI